MTAQRSGQPELAAVEVHGMTRASFILRGALAAGAVYGMGAVAPFVSQALAASGGGDVEILNFALTLEYLESAFYNDKAKQVGLSGQAKDYAKQFGAEEAAHVAALNAAIKKLGGTPVARTDVRLSREQRKVVPGARLGAREHRRRRLQRRRPSSPVKAVLASAGSIVQIEARHAAAINLLIGSSPTPAGLRQAAHQGPSAGQGRPADQGIAADTCGGPRR